MSLINIGKMAKSFMPVLQNYASQSLSERPFAAVVDMNAIGLCPRGATYIVTQNQDILLKIYG